MTPREYINMCKITGLFRFNEFTEELFLMATKCCLTCFGLSEIDTLTYYAGYAINSRMITDDLEELIRLWTLVVEDKLRLKYEESARNIIKGLIKYKGIRQDYLDTYECKTERINILDIVIKSIGSYNEHRRELVVFGQTYTGVGQIEFNSNYDIQWLRNQNEEVHCGKQGIWEIMYNKFHGYYMLINRSAL